MNQPQCNCDGCRSRRVQRQKWNDKNREKRRAINQASTRKLRANRRVELEMSLEEVSDEELDRRMGV